MINDILYNSTKEKYFNFSIYVNLIKLLLPKILKQIFKRYGNIPNYFIQNIDELFKIWRDRWEVFEPKFFQGFFIYTYNYNSFIEIQEYYSKYINKEIDKYLDNIEKINKTDSQKIKILGYENGLDTNCDNSEIIIDLKKIKKMEIIIALSKDIDGNEYSDMPEINEKETSKIQRILKSLNENFNSNNTDNELNNKVLNNDDKNNDKNEINNMTDETKTLNNNEKQILSFKNNEEYYDDIDGEPL